MADMMANLYGNPHSASPSSQLSTNRIEDIRLKVLQFFNADPDEFDVVFVANATAGIKLVMEGLRAVEGGFTYAYHKDSHTSLVGVRESALTSRCMDDEDVERWLSTSERPVEGTEGTLSLFAYPAQSNMDGRRLPLNWTTRVRERQHSSGDTTYTLLDAASFVSTSQLNMSEADKAPDFTVLSFYKIFGFPDLGALIIRKESGHILKKRQYFGGGTVDVVLCVKEQWHASKTQSLHDSLEDGTLPFHNIMALDAAINVHKKLYGTMDRISRHTAFLARKLHDGLSALRHANSDPVCLMHSNGFADPKSHGPIVAFNVRNSQGGWVTNTEFEKLASVRKFHIRSGGLCNPGGVATRLNLEPWEMRRNFSAGFKCGAETDIYAGKITGIIRASLGAMSTLSDVELFVSFVREFYTEKEVPRSITDVVDSQRKAQLVVESLTIYPIKSCGGYEIAPNTPWEVRPEGLAWDREWCLIHQGTGQALSQKRHPRMALIRSELDFQQGVLRVHYKGSLSESSDEIQIQLSANPALFKSVDESTSLSSRVCGDPIIARTYADEKINSFFSSVLGVPCVLARFPAGGSGFTTRHSKAHMQKHQRPKKTSDERPIPGAFPDLPTPPDSDSEIQKRPILLSNESPILAINRASIDALNREILKTGGKIASASVFRANIVLAPSSSSTSEAYTEDHWTSLVIESNKYQMLGSCRRCHMICVDQETAEKDEEPFVTLAKTRRFESKVFFGSHMCLITEKGAGGRRREEQFPTISVGGSVEVEIAE